MTCGHCGGYLYPDSDNEMLCLICSRRHRPVGAAPIAPALTEISPEAVLVYVQDHPRCNASEVAEAFSTNSKRAVVALSLLYHKHFIGRAAPRYGRKAFTYYVVE